MHLSCNTAASTQSPRLSSAKQARIERDCPNELKPALLEHRLRNGEKETRTKSGNVANMFFISACYRIKEFMSPINTNCYQSSGINNGHDGFFFVKLTT